MYIVFKYTYFKKHKSKSDYINWQKIQKNILLIF